MRADPGIDGRTARVAPVDFPSPWTVSFTTYGWLPWISGDLTIKGRSFDVDISAGQVVDALDWSGIPAWFSYAEARNGRVILFNDIVYPKWDWSASLQDQDRSIGWTPSSARGFVSGQNVTIRGDVGGFDIGSEFTWQVVATYDFQLCVSDGYTIDGYLGYRALSVDYSQGSGTNRYEFDAVLHGPVMGATLHF